MPATTATLYTNIPFINMEDPANLYRTAAEIEKARDKWVFHRYMLKQIYHGGPADLRVLKIRGDSMEPVLSDGDAVMINIMDGITSPPGIFLRYLTGLALWLNGLRLSPIATRYLPEFRLRTRNILLISVI